MTISSVWMQNVAYPARLDRQIIDALLDEGVVDKAAGDFAVTERALGATFSVDVAAGRAVVEGDDQANQGSYLIESTAMENVAIGAAPGSNSRIDLVVLQVNDPNAGGGAGDNTTVEVVPGVVAGSPVAPATPDSAIVLAHVLVTSATVSIVNAAITDQRVQVGHAITPEWVPYTPTLAQNGVTVATSVAVIRYQRIGKRVRGYGRVTASAAGTVGTDITVGLPVAVANELGGIGQYIGIGVFTDAGTGRYECFVSASAGASVFRFRHVTVTSGSVVGTSPSFALASGDGGDFSFDYEGV